MLTRANAFCRTVPLMSEREQGRAAPVADKRSTTVTISKRGGYSGGKPGSQMRPPVHTPSATTGRPAASSNGSGGKK